MLHVAAFVSWDLKGPLLFYNDDQWTNETILNAYKQAKPRRRPKTESEDQFDQRVKEWENLQPLGFEKQGNTMTGLYYAQKILPHYVALIDHSHLLHDRCQRRGKSGSVHSATIRQRQLL